MPATFTMPAGYRRPSLLGRVWRETVRPFRKLAARISRAPQPAPRVIPEGLTGSGIQFEGFHPQQATVEEEAIPFLQKLVRESRKYPGPIIEIGTLLGITTTTMALAKAPEQKIITVDLYCWNPWGLRPENHRALTTIVLSYLVDTGHVQQISQDKNEFFRTYKGPPPAMVFLDAIHTYEETKLDIQWAQRVGAKIIAGHDYSDAFPGIKQVVDEFGGPRERVASVWVL